MNTIGNYCLVLSWALTLYGVIIGFWGAKTSNDRLINSGAFAARASFIVASASLVSLITLFLQNDYSNHYVWQFSNREMSPIYKITALWGGMNGSLFFWAWLLALWGAIMSWGKNIYDKKIFAWALPVHLVGQLFFFFTTLFFTNPFHYIQANFVPADGNGLNPLLQNPYMAIHPPMLYCGFTLFSIPYAFCIGSLMANDLTNEWIYATRRWTLVAWGVLTTGIVLGGFWAYIELGWGGFWAWDPVENASFLPWLTGTAFLHSVIIQERKGMLKSWNIFLITLTYGLTVFGTYLTRSGIVQSVHAFAETNFGFLFLGYLIIVAAAATYLLAIRNRGLKSDRALESIFSREAAFLINNLIFLSICFATIWGVLFPVLSEAVTGEKQTIGVPFFNQVNVPLFLFMIFLMGIGSLVAWRKASLSSLRKTFLAPFMLSLLMAALLVWAGVTSFYPILSYSLCFFVFLTIIGEYHRGYKVHGVQVLKKHSRRYGGYLVHLGVLVATVAITSSMAHKIEKEFTLARGETFKVGRFAITLLDLSGIQTGNYDAVTAYTVLKSAADGTVLANLKPEMRHYNRNNENTSEIALRVGPREDFYLVLAGLSEDESHASFKVFINPLQVWLWVGVAIMIAGTGVVLVK